VASAEAASQARQGHRSVRGAIRTLAERGPPGEGGDPSVRGNADGKDPRSAGGEAGVKGELIAVGSELLLFGRRDTNGDWLAGRLAHLGVDVGRRTIVGDDEEEIARAIEAARSRSELVFVTGGLGPTADDLTREGLAR